jgi:iron complex transport system permease protein
MSRWAGRAVILALWAGPVLGLLWPRLSGDAAWFVLLQLRLPRVLAGLTVGASLGVAGAVTQALFGNVLATPSTTGALAGATLGVLLALVSGFDATLSGLPAFALCAFGGAAASSTIVLVASASGRLRTQDVLLIGIAVTLASTALATAMQDIADAPALVAASRWSLGNLAQVGYHGVQVTAPALLTSWAIMLAQIRPLQSLVLGEEAAHARGVNVVRVRVISLSACTLAVATAVAWCGPIAFIGLIVPAIVRLAFGASQRIVLPGSLLTGAALLCFCDALGRGLLAKHEIPVGVITAALGAPVLVVLIVLRERS